MSVRIDVAWDFGKIGGFSLQFTDSGGADTIAVASGQYCHTDISSAVTGYSDFATALQTALNASGTLNGTYTVTYRPTTLDYRIQCTESFTTADPSGTVAGQILGLTGAVGSTTSKTSDVQPYYLISGATGAVSNPTDDYEPDGIAEGGYTLGGAHYAVSNTTAVVFSDFDLQYEAKSAVYSREATGAVPWTYQHMWEHARGEEPFLVDDDSTESVYYLRPEGASFKPERAVANWDDAWHILFRCYLEGRL